MAIKKPVLFFALLLGGAVSARAAGRDPFSFLLMTPSPRAAALGESYAAVAEGPETIFINPGGLGFEKQRHLYFQSLFPPFIEGIKYSNFVYVDPIDDLTAAVQAGVLHVGGFTRTVADPSSADGYRDDGEFSTYDLQAAFALAQRMSEQLSVGATFRYVRESLSDAAANGFAFDAGLLYKDLNTPVQVGFAVQNMGPKTKFRDEAVSLPGLFRVGVSVTQPKGSKRWLPAGSLASADYFKPFHGEASVRGGVEVPFWELVLARIGYLYHLKKQELGSAKVPAGLTFGLGLRTKGWALDYALVSLGELGLTHRLALDLKWNSLI